MAQRRHRQMPLTIAQILAWADVHFAHTGRWPTRASGRISSARTEKWSSVQYALNRGLHGLPGGDSLACLLRRMRGTGERRGRPAQPERTLQACRLRAVGFSLSEIGRRLGVSRQRVFQLLQTKLVQPRRKERAS